MAATQRSPGAAREAATQRSPGAAREAATQKKKKISISLTVLYNWKGKPVLCSAHTPLGPLYYLCELGFLVSFHSYLPAPALSTNSPQAVELIYLNGDSQKFLVIYDPHGAVLNYLILKAGRLITGV